MAELIEEVGARVVLTGRAAYVTEALAVEKATINMAETWAAFGDSAGEGALVVTRAERSVRDETTATSKIVRSENLAQERSYRATSQAALTSGTVIRDSNAKTAESATKTGGLVGGALKSIAVGTTIALGVAAGESAKWASDFQQKMLVVQNMAGVDPKRIPALSKGLLSLGPQVGINADKLADALYRVASASGKLGATNDQMLAMVDAAAKLTAIGGPGTDLEETARVIGGVRVTGIKGLGSGPDQYKRIAGLAAGAVGTGDIRMNDFIQAIGGGALSSAANTGVSAQDVASMIALLGDNLQSGSVSGHGIAHALSILAAPSGVGRKAQTAIGIAPGQLGLEMRQQPVANTFDTLNQHLTAPLSSFITTQAGKADATDALTKMGFTPQAISDLFAKGIGKLGAVGQEDRVRLLTAMFGGAKQALPITTILNETDKFKATRAEVDKTSGPGGIDTRFGALRQTAGFKWDAFKAQVHSLGIEFGTFLLPYLNKALDKLTGVGAWVQDHSAQIEGFASGAAHALGVAFHYVGDALGFFADHGTTTKTILGGLLALFVAKKVIDFAVGVRNAATSLYAFNQRAKEGKLPIQQGVAAVGNLGGNLRAVGLNALEAGGRVTSTFIPGMRTATTSVDEVSSSTRTATTSLALFGEESQAAALQTEQSAGRMSGAMSRLRGFGGSAALGAAGIGLSAFGAYQSGSSSAQNSGKISYGNIAQGAATGALAGAFIGPEGAAVGALVGAGASLTGQLLNLGTASKAAADAAQQQADELTAANNANVDAKVATMKQAFVDNGYSLSKTTAAVAVSLLSSDTNLAAAFAHAGLKSGDLVGYLEGNAGSVRRVTGALTGQGGILGSLATTKTEFSGAAGQAADLGTSLGTLKDKTHLTALAMQDAQNNILVRSLLGGAVPGLAALPGTGNVNTATPNLPAVLSGGITPSPGVTAPTAPSITVPPPTISDPTSPQAGLLGHGQASLNSTNDMHVHGNVVVHVQRDDQLTIGTMRDAVLNARARQ